jgi:hypothetical protein
MLALEILRLAAIILMTFGILTLTGVLLFLGAMLALDDALFARRMIWLSWPVTAALGALLSWCIARAIRMRWKLVTSLKAWAFDCPYCGERLPPWDGTFRGHPDEPECVLWNEGPPWGRLRFRCERCRRDVWLYCWASGNVNRAGWDPTGPGCVLELDEF